MVYFKKPTTDIEKEFIKLYEEMCNETKDPDRLKRLEVLVDKTWATFDQEAKDRIWQQVYPEQAKIMAIFGPVPHAVNLRAPDLFGE